VGQILPLLRNVLDVLVLAFLIYKIYDIFAKSQAGMLINGVIYIVIIYALAFLLKLSTIMWILNLLAPGLLIALAVVFQPEIRKMIIRFGGNGFFRQNARMGLGQLDPVITAAEYLSALKCGMLIVFPRRTNLRHIIETGTGLNAEISSGLLITIFLCDGSLSKNGEPIAASPLHDGAVVLQGNKIAAAGCILPVSQQQDIRKSFGTRHRAALGMSEESDAVILIVSEETGAISLAYDGQIYYDLPKSTVRQKLSQLLDKTLMGAEEGGRQSPFVQSHMKLLKVKSADEKTADGEADG
jgi:diadenylate cyclase